MKKQKRLEIAARAVRKAWEYGGEGYKSPKWIEDWLNEKMKPAMHELKDALAELPAKARVM